MARRGWYKFLKPEIFTELSEAPQTQGIHVYLFWSKEGERYLSHTGGDVTAEELCISAAEAVGESDSWHHMTEWKCFHDGISYVKLGVCTRVTLMSLPQG